MLFYKTIIFVLSRLHAGPFQTCITEKNVQQALELGQESSIEGYATLQVFISCLYYPIMRFVQFLTSSFV